MFHRAFVLITLIPVGLTRAADCWKTDLPLVIPNKTDITSVAHRFCTPSPLDNNNAQYTLNGAVIRVSVNVTNSSFGFCNEAIDNILSLCSVGGGWWQLWEQLYMVDLV